MQCYTEHIIAAVDFLCFSLYKTLYSKNNIKQLSTLTQSLWQASLFTSVQGHQWTLQPQDSSPSASTYTCIQENGDAAT